MSIAEWPPIDTGGGGGITSINGDTTAAQLIVGGSGITVGTAGGTTTITATNSGTVTNVTATSPLASSGGTTPDISLSGVVSVAHGGTSLATLTANNVILGNGTSAPNFVAPGTSGNVLTSNGTTWTSAAPTGSITGSGTTDFFTKWTSSTAIGNSAWKENTSITTGEMLYQNFSTNKGTKANPLFNLNGSTSAGTGLYTNAGNDINFTCAGNLYANIDGTDFGGIKIFRSSLTTADYYGLRHVGASGFQLVNSGSNSPPITIFPYGTSTQTTQVNLFYGGTSPDFSLQFYSPSHTSLAGTSLLSVYDTTGGAVGRTGFTSTRAGGQGVGGFQKVNAMTVFQHADISGVGGTTTANAATTITGSSTQFLNDFGLGDRVSLSSSAGTYATVTAIASNTSMTVSSALGNGSSQTLNKKQAHFRTLDSSGNTSLIINDQAFVGVGLTIPVNKLHLDAGNATSYFQQFTQGTTTGVTSADGVLFGYATGGGKDFTFNNQESADFYYKLNGTNRVRIRGDNGRVTIGDTTETIAFFLTDEQKLLVSNGYSSVNNLINITSLSVSQYTPSADTNSGTFGVTIQTSAGSNMDMLGAHSFNGGIPLGNQTTYSTSAFGYFCQTNYKATAGTLDGAQGGLFTVNHSGYGGNGSSGAIIGGSFDASTTDDAGGGTPTGSMGTLIGGNFTSGLGGGVSVTNSISAQFNEPLILSFPFTGTITNQVAANVNGTMAITQTDDSSTGTVNGLAVPTSHIHLTGNPTINGIVADAFAKFLVLTCDAGMVLNNQSGSATSATYRIITGSGAAITVTADGAVTLKYDTTNSRWRVVSSIL